MQVLFSKSKLGFYLKEKEDSYKGSGSLPKDCVLLSAQQVEQFFGKNPPIGKVLGAGGDGFPCWLDKVKSIVEIQDLLEQIDLATVRPLRAVQNGTATQQDIDKLTALENEAVQLRTELGALNG